MWINEYGEGNDLDLKPFTISQSEGDTIVSHDLGVSWKLEKIVIILIRGCLDFEAVEK